MSLNIKTKFYGTSVGVIPQGETTVKLYGRNEVYSLSRPIIMCHNIIFGTMYNEVNGIMKIKKESPSNSTGSEASIDEMEIEFKKGGWSR